MREAQCCGGGGGGGGGVYCLFSLLIAKSVEVP